MSKREIGYFKISLGNPRVPSDRSVRRTNERYRLKHPSVVLKKHVSWSQRIINFLRGVKV